MWAQSLSHVQLSSDPVDCSPPGSSVHGTLKARILEWGAMPSSRGSSRPRDRTLVFGTAGGSLPPPPPGKPSKSNLYKARPSRGSIYPVLSPQPRPSLLWGSKRLDAAQRTQGQAVGGGASGSLGCGPALGRRRFSLRAPSHPGRLMQGWHSSPRTTGVEGIERLQKV